MANQITDNRTLVSSASNATNWVATSSATLDTEIFIEGTSSIGEQITSGVRYMMYNAGSAQNWSNNVFYIWINCGIVGLLDTQANGGFRIRFAGPTVTNYFEVYIGGSDSWPNAIAGGWVQFVVDIETARSTAITNGWTGGTPPATTAIQHVGYAATTAGTMTRNTDNTWIDAIWRLPDGSPGIIVEGRNGGSTPWTFSNIFTQLGQSAGSFRQGPGGSWVINTPLQIGINDTTIHSFADSNQLILWDNQQYAPNDLYRFSALGNAGGTTSVVLGQKTGSGDTAVGSQGITFSAAVTGVRYDVDFDDANLNTVGFYGCTFIHGGDFQMDSSVLESINTQYIDCSSATISNSLQLNNSIIDANTADGVAFMITDDLTDIRFCSFQFSDGHAVQLTTPRVATQESRGNTFNGYGAIGTNDAAIYNNTSGAVTINVTNGGNTPTYRNGTGASTTVNNAVTLTVTNIYPDSEIRIFTDDLNRTELAGSESVSGSLTQIQIVNGGSGYTVGDTLTIQGGTFTTAAQVQVATVSGGVITSVTIVTPGSYSDPPSNPASVTGGTGTGATFNTTIRGSFSYQYNYTIDTPIIIVVFHLRFKDIWLVGQQLLSTPQSIPIQQITDRIYSNP